MALPHAQPCEVIDVKPFGAALAGTRSHALFKSAGLELIRIVLRAGEQMRPHAVAGEITVQCIEGMIAFSCDSGEIRLEAGQLVHVTGDEVHGLRGIEDSSALLTIAFKS